MKHVRSHSHYFVMLQKVPLNERVDSVKQCTGCEEIVDLGYSCQLCPYALCLGCWRVVGINRREHQIFNLHELQEDYGKSSIVYKIFKTESSILIFAASLPVSVNQHKLLFGAFDE